MGLRVMIGGEGDMVRVRVRMSDMVRGKEREKERERERARESKKQNLVMSSVTPSSSTSESDGYEPRTLSVKLRHLLFHSSAHDAASALEHICSRTFL